MSQFYSLKVNQIKKETHDSVSVSFEIESKLANDFKFIPGQYITIKININGEDCRRSYSICSSSNEKLTIAIKKVPRVFFREFLENYQAETSFEIAKLFKIINNLV
jgi:ring-1,2-phenylacetyl-CoA epoxidase subunit PaaE